MSRRVLLCLTVFLVAACSPSNESDSMKPIPEGANRLAREKSPYLLQHAYNPVDWYSWGAEAFAKAIADDKPIFLSIGYSTCHWCHVMEHESFEDTAVARLMNENFVSIKVDREERPDIDNIYMTVCQMMTRGGGWPLTIIMTPDKKPFFAATYIPKESRMQRIGMLDLIPRVAEVWNTRREELLGNARQITEALNQVRGGRAGDMLGEETLHLAMNQLTERFDTLHGGFGTAPKFPLPHNLMFLLRQWRRTGATDVLAMVEQTLGAMRRGGMYDQIGFGFHRYSTDPEWLLPHFEKMLYDQAMLAMAYTEAFQATGKSDYEQTAHEIFTYVLRDMTSPEGDFYSAEDADSEGKEGKFYVWTEAEIRELLRPEEAKLAIRVFGIEPGGNFTDEATQERTGANILHLSQPLAAAARDLKIPEAELVSQLTGIREKLFTAREARVHPSKDDKILTDWNGLMIAALAKAGRVFDDAEYIAAAERAADFILSTMRDADGRLLHRFRDGEAGLPAHVDDYAFSVWGMIELYESTFDVHYLKTALELNASLIHRFWDNEQGGLYFTADDSEELIARTKEVYDGAIPSGNSVAALNLLRLGRLTADPQLDSLAEEVISAFAGEIGPSPSAFTQMMIAVDFATGPSYEVVLAAEPDAADTKAMLRPLYSKFIPNKVVVLRPSNEQSPEIVKLAEYTNDQGSIDGRATAYVCRNYACQLPTTDPAVMLSQLGVGD
jgi:uncharacterized protein YyaL (SSP411 family)